MVESENRMTLNSEEKAEIACKQNNNESQAQIIMCKKFYDRIYLN